MSAWTSARSSGLGRATTRRSGSTGPLSGVDHLLQERKRVEIGAERPDSVAFELRDSRSPKLEALSRWFDPDVVDDERSYMVGLHDPLGEGLVVDDIEPGDH